MAQVRSQFLGIHLFNEISPEIFTGSCLSSDNDDIMWKKATYLYKLLLLSTVST